MSLINQMLQELDARRSEVTGKDTYGQQIRAVPQQRRMHPAWWVVGALGVILVALLAWLLLRPAPQAVQEPERPQPLKLDVDLNAPPAQRHPATPVEAGPALAPALPEPLVEVAAPVPQVKEAPALPAPELTRAAAPIRPSVPEATPQAQEPARPVAINKQVKELSPQQRAENEYRKSTHLLQQGKTSEAVGSLEQALQLDPLHAGARQALIGLFLEERRQEDAMRLARDGLELDPSQPGLAMILARLQLEKGELRTAIATLERTLPHAVERSDYQAFLAALLQRDERHKQAAEHYLLALQKTPQSGVWWMGLGISLQAEQRTAEAQEAFRRAKSTNSLTPELLAFVEARLSQLQR